MFFLPLIHTLPQTQNQKSSTNIKNQPLEQNRWIGDRWLWIMDWRGDLDRWCGSVLMEIGDGLMWIGVDGDRFWWRLVLMEIGDGLMEIGVDGVLVMGWLRSVLMKISFMGWWRSVLMECLWWCFWVDEDRWIGEALWWLWWLWCWWSSCSGAFGFWTWEKEEERKGRKERGNGSDKEKERRRRKKRKYWKKQRVGKIILKNEYKNIIYIKYSV